MATSKLQRRMSQLLSTFVGGLTVRENIRPDWLIGSKGERLELDFYIEDLNIAIEVQGKQHYEYTPRFHASYQAFQAQQERDIAKRAGCDLFGVLLFEVFDEESALATIATIAKCAPEQPIEPVAEPVINPPAETLNAKLLALTNGVERALASADLMHLGYMAFHLKTAIQSIGVKRLPECDAQIASKAIQVANKALQTYRKHRKELKTMKRTPRQHRKALRAALRMEWTS